MCSETVDLFTLSQIQKESGAGYSILADRKEKKHQEKEP